MTDSQIELQNVPLAGKRRKKLIAYNVMLAVVSSIALVALIAFTPSLSSDSNLTDAVNGGAFRWIVITTLIAMFVAGATGGVLCNLCNANLPDYAKGNQADIAQEELDYYLRPLKGAVTGLLAFFVGNLLVTSLSINATEQSWATLTGRLPYIAVAILAGYASPEFMSRLKEVARAIFSADDKKVKPDSSN